MSENSVKILPINIGMKANHNPCTTKRSTTKDVRELSKEDVLITDETEEEEEE